MNVTIQWSKGAPPVLSIYNETGHKTNSIDLAQYDDKEKLDTLMVEKGFRKMTEEETEQWKQKKKEQREKEVKLHDERRKQRIERAKKMDEEGTKDPKIVRARDKEPLVENQQQQQQNNDKPKPIDPRGEEL